MGYRQNGLERAFGGKAVGEDIPSWHVVDRKAGHCALGYNPCFPSMSQ
jgi:hypothetical protein